MPGTCLNPSARKSTQRRTRVRFVRSGAISILSGTGGGVYRKQNDGDYQIPTIKLKPGPETLGAVRFALHVAEPKTCLRCRED